MPKTNPTRGTETPENVGKGISEMTGLLGGLGSFIEKLTDLAEKGRELRESGEFQSGGKKLHGVYRFTIKTGLRSDQQNDVKVELFGKVRTDAKTGKAMVHEVLEPMVDIFDEPQHVQIIAEMAGVGENDIRLELQDDVLIIEAEHGTKKYRKEVLLPSPFSADKMSHSCHHGILEVTLQR
jgi:HSP20 family protein